MFRTRGKKDYSPKSWSDYFEEKKQITINENIFQYYKSGSSNNLLILFLHGGGFSGLSWALLSVSFFTIVLLYILHKCTNCYQFGINFYFLTLILTFTFFKARITL